MNSRGVKLAGTLFVAFFVCVGSVRAQGVVGDTSARPPTALRPGDVLQINVWPDPDRQWGGEFVVEETGFVYLPLVERVRVEGISIDQLRQELRQRYGEAIRNPVVTVTPMYRVSITGEVTRPGIQMVTPAHSLFDVIGLAGGFRQGADAENVRIVRPGAVIEFDALRALETGDGMDAVQLRSGDHIVVPARRPPLITWRNVLTVLQTVSLIAVTWDRLTR